MPYRFRNSPPLLYGTHLAALRRTSDEVVAPSRILSADGSHHSRMNALLSSVDQILARRTQRPHCTYARERRTHLFTKPGVAAQRRLSAISRVDRAQWYEIVEQAGVAIRLPDGETRRPLLYEAHNTAATLLLARGVDDTTIKAVLGHSSVLSTQASLHTDHTRTRAALAASAEMVGLGR